MDHEISSAIDSMFESFNLEQLSAQGPKGRKAITIWLTPEYQKKYEMIQQRSGSKFSKLLKEVIKRSIDKVLTKEIAPHP